MLSRPRRLLLPACPRSTCFGELPSHYRSRVDSRSHGVVGIFRSSPVQQLDTLRLLLLVASAGDPAHRYDDRENDLFLCDTNTCKFDGECLRIGDTVTCVCQFKCNSDYVPVCGSNGDTYQNECYLRQAACKQQSEILVASEGSCATGRELIHGVGSDRDAEDPLLKKKLRIQVFQMIAQKVCKGSKWEQKQILRLQFSNPGMQALDQVMEVGMFS
ncbi:hypothetical protein L345_07369, partial [Ophiophagus hannah]